MTAALKGSEWSAARPGRTLPPGKTRYPLYRRLGGPQGRSGRAENLVTTWIRSRTVHPVAQSLYRLSYPAHMNNTTAQNSVNSPLNWNPLQCGLNAVDVIKWLKFLFRWETFEHRAYTSIREWKLITSEKISRELHNIYTQPITNLLPLHTRNLQISHHVRYWCISQLSH